ncbi:UNVERIFIED_CONTAM: hypothetical protein B566_EDAN018566 [Ephemera danica]|nr:hypothetical protein B566_EDAN018566 [Ephemera danica]
MITIQAAGHVVQAQPPTGAIENRRVMPSMSRTRRAMKRRILGPVVPQSGNVPSTAVRHRIRRGPQDDPEDRENLTPPP